MFCINVLASAFSIRSIRCGVHCAATMLWLNSSCVAQELEIGRWNHLPVNQNFVTANYGHTDGDIAFDPLLRIENTSVAMDTWLLGYIRTFELFDKTARIEVRQAWQTGHWTGMVNGTPTSISREGWADTFVRIGVNLLGAPPLAGSNYASYRAATKVETIVGAALGVQIPTGKYLDDKLINLGTNRFTFRPQMGIQHHHDNWTFNATGMAMIFTENSSFFGGNRLEQAPFYTIDGTVKYSFESGLWASASAGIGVGGRSTVNDSKKDDYKENYAWAVSLGFPVTSSVGFKVAYIETDHWARVGTASQTVSIALVGTW